MARTQQPTAWYRRLVLTLGSVALVFSLLPGLASAAEPTAEPTAEDSAGEASFALVPLGQPDGVLRVTLEPGSTYTVDVQLSNNGTAVGTALTYAANVTTSAVGGGASIGSAGSEPTGATRWLTYPDEEVVLPAGAKVLRKLSIDVPSNVSAGEYRAALVIQKAVADEQVVDGGVRLATITRQAIVVTITVPGTLTPAMEIGAALIDLSRTQPTVDVGLTNTGNTRLQPIGNVTMRTASGDIVLQQAVEMGPVYGGDTTAVRVPLSTTPPDGSYLLDVELRDPASGIEAHASSLALNVATVTDSEASSESSTFIDRLGELPGQEQMSAATGGQPLWLIGLLGAAVIAAAAGVMMFVRRPRVVVAGIVPSASRTDEWQ